MPRMWKIRETKLEASLGACSPWFKSWRINSWLCSSKPLVWWLGWSFAFELAWAIYRKI